MAPTGFFFHPDLLAHDTGPGHPERAGRLEAVLEHLGRAGLLEEAAQAAPDELNGSSTTDGMALVHPPEHLSRLAATCAAARPQALIDADTVICEASWQAARRSTAGVLDTLRRVDDRTWSNAFCCSRPPGHHAGRATAMGFCLVNHIAIAARWLQHTSRATRVAILDWDVHHGNGTQHIFEEDATVFYASLHQWPAFPGTGEERERGTRAGEGATLNVPLPVGAGDPQWLAALEDRVLPAIEDFAPDFLLISAGFDAHRDDPLAETRLSTEAFAAMTRSSLDLARKCCHGKLVSVLEGGYDLAALGESATAHFGALVSEEQASR